MNRRLMEKIADARIFMNNAKKLVNGKLESHAFTSGIGGRIVRGLQKAEASGVNPAAHLELDVHFRELRKHLAGELIGRNPNLSSREALREAGKILNERVGADIGQAVSVTTATGAQDKAILKKLEDMYINHPEAGRNLGKLGGSMTGNNLSTKQVVKGVVRDPTTGEPMRDGAGKVIRNMEPLMDKAQAGSISTIPAFKDGSGKVKPMGAQLFTNLGGNYVDEVEKTVKANTAKLKDAGKYTPSEAPNKGDGYMWPALLGGSAAIGGGMYLSRDKKEV